MAVHAKNEYLTQSEMEDNARYVYAYLVGRGWSPSAVCGMLGNMQSESTINPAIWEGLDSSDPSRGYGLVQWTPSTKYTSWCAENDLDPASMVSALKRIEYEVENGLQWIQTEYYPMSFKEFKTSDMSASYLGMVFLYNYERPKDLNQTNRGAQAQAWFDLLDGSTPTPTHKSKKMDLMLLISATRRR